MTVIRVLLIFLPVFCFGQTGASQVFTRQNGTGAVLRSSEQKMRDIVSLKDFGAVCDGATDDFAAYVNAIAATRLGGTIRLPAETCRTTRALPTLTRSQTIEGDSVQASQIFCDIPNDAWCVSQGDNLPILNPANNFNNYSPGGLSRLTLRGPGITGNAANGLYLGGDPTAVVTPANFQANWMYYTNVRVTQFAGTQVQYGNNAYAITWQGNWSITSGGIPIRYPAGLTNGGENYNFHGGSITDNNCPILLDVNTADFHFYGTSFDYNNNNGTCSGGWQGQISGVSPNVELFGVYMEKSNAPFVDYGSASTYARLQMIGGKLNVAGVGGTDASLINFTNGGTGWLDIQNVRVESNHTITQAVNFAPLGDGSSIRVQDLYGNFLSNILATTNDLKLFNFASHVDGPLTNVFNEPASLISGGNLIHRTVINSVNAYNFKLQKRGHASGGGASRAQQLLDGAAAVLTGSQLGVVTFDGWDGVAYGVGGFISPVTAENWDGTHHGTTINFGVTPTGSTSPTNYLGLNTGGFLESYLLHVFDAQATFNGNAVHNGSTFLWGSVAGTHGQNVGPGDSPAFAGLTVTVSVFANNAAAIAGGLVAGQIYRNGDILQIVH